MDTSDVGTMEGNMEGQEGSISREAISYDNGEDEFGRAKEVYSWRKLDFSKLDDNGRKACHELFRRGDIDWFLHPEQAKLLQWISATKADLLTICISRQFGKSFMLLAYCIAYCLKHPGTSVLFVAPTKKQVAEIILPRINSVFSFLPDDLVPSRRGYEWTFQHNGSTFNIEGVNIGGGTRLRGGAVPHLVIIDECRDIPELRDVIDSAILPMLSTTDGKIVLVSTPPESPMHAFTEHYIGQALKNGTFYTATYKHNALLSAKFIKRLFAQYKGGEENAIFAREYMARYDITDPERRVVREWDEDNNDSWFTTYDGPRTLEGKPLIVRPYTTMDYAHSDPCGILYCYYDSLQGCLIVIGEHFERAMNTDDVGRLIIKQEDEVYASLPKKAETIRIMDLNPTLMSDLRSRFALKFRPCPKIPNDIQMLNRLRVAIAEGKVRVDRKCVQLRHQLKCGVFNITKTDYMRSDAGGHLDLLDALKYLVLAINWNEIIHNSDEKKALKQGEFVIGPNPFAQSSFGAGVLQRPR